MTLKDVMLKPAGGGPVIATVRLTITDDEDALVLNDPVWSEEWPAKRRLTLLQKMVDVEAQVQKIGDAGGQFKKLMRVAKIGKTDTEITLEA